MELDDWAKPLAASLVAPQVAALQPAWRWSQATPKARITLPCGNCGHRIAWWTAKIRDGWLGLQDATYRGWKWQGQGECPVSFRRDLVDVQCHDCGWQKPGAARQPYPSWWKAAPEVL